MRPKVAFLPLYDRTGPSSRYRVFQFIEPLRRYGFDCSVLPAPQRQPLKRLAYLPRLFLAARRHDLLFVQKRLFPPWALAAVLRLNPRLAFDFDDAIYLQPGRQPALGRMLSQARAVTAGNAAPAEYARRFSKRMQELPSVVDTDYYRPAPAGSQPPDDRLVLGWIGISPQPADFESLRPALKSLLERFGKQLVVRFVAAAPPVWLDEIEWEFVRWSLSTALQQLHRFHIGLMPLAPTPWNAGKCGLKLLQYLAVGLPAVASPVGANTQIMVEGQTGLLASTSVEWQPALEKLISSAQLRGQLGAAGRQSVVERYSLQALLPRLVEVLQSAAEVGR